jgi:hypothetical protein
MKMKNIILLGAAFCALKNVDAAMFSAQELRTNFAQQAPSIVDLCKIIDETELTIEQQKLFFTKMYSALQHAIESGNFTLPDEVLCKAMEKLCTVLTEEETVSDKLAWSGDPKFASRRRFVRYYTSEIDQNLLRLVQMYRATSAFARTYLSTCSRSILNVKLPDLGPWSFSALAEIDIDVYVDADGNAFRLRYNNKMIEIDTQEGYYLGDVSSHQQRLAASIKAFCAEHGEHFQIAK